MRAELINFVNTTAWAMRPEALRAVMTALAAGEQRPVQAAARPAVNIGAVQVIPLTGPITQRGGGLFELFFGGTSTESFTKTLRQALNDQQVGAIVIDVDSPGGSVNGVEELSAELYRARGQKPIVAVANTLAASAAYWIATAADKLLVSPSGEVGSIGVWAAHVDYSGALEQAGQRVTLVGAGKYKTEGNPYEALSDEARTYLQARVDDYYTDFVRAVARNRGVSADAVRDGYGEGRVLGARDALKAGMVDGIGTFDAAVSMAVKFAGQAQRERAQRADAELRARMAGI